METTELDHAEELKLLKERADLLGIKYSNNIGLEHGPCRSSPETRCHFIRNTVN